MVALTGQVPTDLLGTDAFQETDIIGITMPITKHSFLVRDPRDMRTTLKQAFPWPSRAGRGRSSWTFRGMSWRAAAPRRKSGRRNRP